MAPSAAPAPTTVCSSSMNRMTWPSLSLISLRTALRRSSNSPRNLAPAMSAPRSSDDDALVLERLGHVAAHDALGEALGDGRLADAGLADQDRVVLGPAAEDLDDPPDLLVAADDRVEPARAGLGGQVAAVLLERGVGALRVLGGDPLAAADALEGLQDGLPAGRVALQDGLGLAAGLGHAEQQVLGRDVLVAEAAGLGLGALDDRAGPAGPGSASRPGCGPAGRGPRRPRHGTRRGPRPGGAGSRPGCRRRARRGRSAGARHRAAGSGAAGRSPGRRRRPPGPSG